MAVKGDFVPQSTPKVSFPLIFGLVEPCNVPFGRLWHVVWHFVPFNLPFQKLNPTVVFSFLTLFFFFVKKDVTFEKGKSFLDFKCQFYLDVV